MNRTLLVRLGGAALLLAGVFTAYTYQAPAELTMTEVADDLYMIEGDGGNVGVYVTEEGVIVIDDKYERDFDNLMANIRKVTNQPVKYVLDTHHHGDHTGGNAQFLKTAEVLAHKNARENMVRGDMPGVPRLSYDDELEIHLGGKTIRAMYFGRGHTDGDVVIFFPDVRAAHTGDLYAGNPFVDYANGGSLKDWSGTLEGVLGQDFETVIPGHGPAGTRKDVVQQRQNVEQLRELAARMAREGRGADDLRKAIINDFGWPDNAFQLSAVGGMLAEMKPASE